MEFFRIPIKRQITEVRQARRIYTVRRQATHAKLRERTWFTFLPFTWGTQTTSTIAHTKNVIANLTQIYHQTAYGIGMLGFDG